MRSRPVLSGPRGWGLVGVLAVALLGTVAVQLPAAADAPRPGPLTVPGTSAAVPPGGAALRLEAAPAREARAASAAVRAATRQAARRAATSTAVAAVVPGRRTPGAGSPAALARAAGRAAGPPTTRAHCSGAGWQQRRGAAALAALRPAPSPASAVRFRPARSGLLGLTSLEDRSVEVFVRPCTRQSDALLRHVVAHELGHAHDVAHLTPDRRAAWMRVRGIPAGTPWFGCDRCTDFATPAGDFAETYAQWRRGAASSRSAMAPPPGPAALERLAATFFTR